MDPKCKECGYALMSRHCECPSNIMNQPDPARTEALKLMHTAKPFNAGKASHDPR